MRDTHLAGMLALCAVLATFSAQAQRDNRSMETGVTNVINSDDADREHVENTLKDNAPQTTGDNGLPRFAVVGKERQFYLGIGAQFLGEGVFTWGDDMPSALDFTPSSLTPSTPGNRSNLQFAWQSSSVYLNFVAMPGTDNKIGLFFKGKFNADKTFKCSHFYAKYRGLTVGYTKSVFSDGASVPMTIDGEGPDGFADMTVFTANWQQKFTDHISGAIGIDAPVVSMTTGNSAVEINQRIPAVPMYLQYAWDSGSHIRVSGIVRPIQYRDAAEGKNSAMVGGGVQLSGVTHIAGGLSASFNGVYGKGIANYLQDDNDFQLDAVPLLKAGDMAAVKSFGATAGLTYVFSPKVSSNIVYSHLTNWLPDDSAASGSLYRYGDYVAANVIYSFNKFLSAGVEYDYGRRKSFDGEGLHANRLQCQLAVTF